MILEYLSDEITPELLAERVQGIEIDTPDEDDYNPDLWSEMRSKRFISVYEKIKGHDGQWQLSFNNGKLYLIQFNIELGSKSENSYNRCIDLCKSILKINNSTRGMNEHLTGSCRRSYNEFKSETMSVSGIPDGSYVQFADYKWESGTRSASLSAGCNWPDLMSVEYREDSYY